MNTEAFKDAHDYFSQHPDACCPECKYGLTGLTQWRCPECGTHLTPQKLELKLEILPYRELPKWISIPLWGIGVTVWSAGAVIFISIVVYISESFNTQGNITDLVPLLPLLVMPAYIAALGVRKLIKHDTIGWNVLAITSILIMPICQVVYVIVLVETIRLIG